jgi:hypothetical protein
MILKRAAGYWQLAIGWNLPVTSCHLPAAKMLTINHFSFFHSLSHGSIPP